MTYTCKESIEAVNNYLEFIGSEGRMKECMTLFDVIVQNDDQKKYKCGKYEYKTRRGRLVFRPIGKGHYAMSKIKLNDAMIKKVEEI